MSLMSYDYKYYSCVRTRNAYDIYSRARKLFGHLNARRRDFNINIIIPTRKPPLSVRNKNKMQKLYILRKR